MLMFMGSSARTNRETQHKNGKRNIEGREGEGCVINSLDASYVLFKRGVTTIYDRGVGDRQHTLNHKPANPQNDVKTVRRRDSFEHAVILYKRLYSSRFSLSQIFRCDE